MSQQRGQKLAEARVLLNRTRNELNAVSQDELLMTETPLEVQSVIDSAVKSIGEALRQLSSATTPKQPSLSPPSGAPTRQQGQFLAFIREYMMRNEAGVAPSHADFQRFFNLTPPSVNSMLIRLEQRGFIRRVPGKARAIELVVNTNWIPPLDRPFKYLA